MKRFFNWIFKVFRPDSSRYVKNLQDQPSGNTQEAYVTVKKKKSGQPVLAWIATKDVVENKEDNQGVTLELVLKTGAQFKMLGYHDQITISSQKKGLSAVEHQIVFGADSGLPDDLKSTGLSGASVTFLHRTAEGECLILGEAEGLKMSDGDEGSVVFKGRENDVFYRVSEDCFYTLLPNIE